MSYSQSSGSGRWRILLASGCLLLLAHLGGAAPPTSIRPEQLDNWFAYIPPSCYVETLGEGGRAHNACYVCHQKGRAPNFIDDSDLQLEYSFPAPARKNRWSNLLKDRSQALRQISDEEIAAYVQEDNYMTAAGQIALAGKLSSDLPAAWDTNGDGVWGGFVPDVFYNLDAEGFDHDPDGNYNGWRKYNYMPLPGNFSPASGSVGDGFIRLGEALRSDRLGHFDLAVYKLNLAIVEAAIKQRTVGVGSFDERDFGVDLDRDGELGQAQAVVFCNEPGSMKLVGKAGALQSHGKIHLEAGLFPEFTEFFHSLRYLEVSESGEVTAASRMKEIRYSVKKRWYPPLELARFAADENKEKAYTPDRPRWVRGNQEFGVSNALAWQYRGFIEDRSGQLRPQTHQELVSCVGCHSGVGATTDSNFSFARKLSDGGQDYFSLETSRVEQAPQEKAPRELARFLNEYSFYLQNNQAANDFRRAGTGVNRPVTRYNIDSHFWPDAEDAVRMNKAYRVTVLEQSFTEGRDPIVSPPATILQEVEAEKKTGVTIPVAPRSPND